MSVQTKFPLNFRGSRRIGQWMAFRGVGGLVPVVVYQMAKVGSSAVVGALVRSRIPAFHIHRMSETHLHEMRARRRDLGWRIPPVPPHDRLGLKLYETVVAPRHAAKFITLVRDPIARNLSSYFEHLDFIWDRVDAHQHVPIAALCHGFHERYTHDEPLTWFDNELEPVLGVDVYSLPFPRSGHTILHGERADVLILKSEIADEVKRAALVDYLGVPIAPFERTNETAATAKGTVYREFLQSVRLSPAYVDRLLDSRYTRHFYDDGERAAMRRRYVSEAA